MPLDRENCLAQNAFSEGTLTLEELTVQTVTVGLGALNFGLTLRLPNRRMI